MTTIFTPHTLNVHPPPATPGASAVREVVFIDSRVPDLHSILAALRPGVKAVVLNDHEDGAAQMARALQGEQGLASISVVSHGDAGALLLGRGALFTGNLAQHQGDLQAVGAALAADGDLLLYGCNVGAGDKGAAFVAALAQATGADVAASSNSTGGAGRGGDWALEVASGSIEAAPVLQASALAGYDFVLHTATASTLAELKAAIASAQGDGAHDLIALTGDIVFASALDTVQIHVTDGHTLRLVGGGHTLSGNDLARVMEVNTSGVGSAVEISGLTIAHGLVVGAGGSASVGYYTNAGSGGDALGAGIWNQGTLSLVGSAVTGNRAAGGGGGGVDTDNEGGTPGRAGNTSTSPNGNISGSSGTHSGGLASDGSSSIGGGGGGISGNMGSPWDGGQMAGRGGHAVGGIYNSGTLTLLGTDFSGNLGAGGGGGSGITLWPEFISGSGGTGVGSLWNAGGSVRMDTSTQGALTTGNSGAGGKVELNRSYHPLALVGQSIAGLHSPTGTVDSNYVPPPAILSATYDGVAGTLVVTATGLQATAGAANDIGVGALTLTGQGGASYTLTSAAVEIDSATQFTVQLSAADRSPLANLLNKTGLQANDASSYSLSAASGWSAAHPGNADLTGNPVIAKTVNAAPTLTTSTGAVSFTEGNNVLSTPVVIDSSLTLADADSATLVSATVAITGNFQNGQDVLGLISDSATMGDITGSYNASTGVLTLTSAGAAASAAQYQAALRSVTYTNSSDLPVEGVRTIGFSANDGSLSSAVGSKNLNVIAVNDAPINHLPAAAQTVVQGETLAFSNANGNLISISDADAGSQQYVVVLQVTGGRLVGDGFSGVHLTLQATLSNMNNALSRLKFVPDAGFYGAASLRMLTRDDLTVSDSASDDDTLSITVTRPAAQVTGVSASSADGTYKVGDTVTVAVTFDQAVTLDTTNGTPTLLLETGSTDRSAQYLSGSGSSALVFAYTVQAGDNADDLDYTSSAALALNGATLHNASGVASNLALPVPGSAQSLAGQSALVIDGVRPTASITMGDTALGVGETTQVTITFSEAVTGLTVDDLSAGNAVLSDLASSDGGKIWTATLTPNANVTVAANAIVLDNTGITDLAGNPGAGTTDSGNYAINTVVPINAVPTVAIPVPDQSATQGAAFTFQVAANAFTDVDVGDTLTYTAQRAGGSALPSWLSFDATSRTFSGTPANGDVGTVSISVAASDGKGGTVADSFDITVANVNDAPTVAIPVPDQSATQGAAFTFQFAANAFIDVDVGDTLTYSAQLAGGGALPSWLSFDATSRTFSGTPGNTHVGTLSIDLVADDSNGGTVTDTFSLVVQAVVPPAPPPVDPVPVEPTPPPLPPPAGDKDGIPPALEDSVPGIAGPGGAAPLAGDGNGDGIKDSLQAEVASTAFVLSPSSQSQPGSAPATFITLVTNSLDGKVDSASSSSRITSFTQQDAPANLPDGLEMPMGLVAFTVELQGGASSESFSLYVDASLGINGYWKQDSTGTWVNLASAPYGGKTVLEGGRLRLDFQIADGGEFDADGKVDGVITDPGAPAYLPLSIIGVAPAMPADGFWF